MYLIMAYFLLQRHIPSLLLKLVSDMKGHKTNTTASVLNMTETNKVEKNKAINNTQQYNILIFDNILFFLVTVHGLLENE